MSTTAPERPANPAPESGGVRVERPGGAPPVVDAPRRWKPALLVLAVWFVLYLVLKGQDTLVLPGRDHTALHNTFSAFRDSMLAGRATNPVMQFTGVLADGLRAVVEWMQHLISIPDPPRPVPQIGWLGVTAVATWVAGAISNWKMALLTLGTFLTFGLFGYWSDSMDLLIITLVTVVICLIIGLPLAVVVGTTKRPAAVIEGILDVLQTMPSFIYLLPIVLFFGIGISGAVAATLAYSVASLIRIAGHGIRGVNPAMIEVTDSLGQTRWQRLLKVQLPLARSTIIVGLNQTFMAALSMAVLASFINGPGLGKAVFAGLQINDVGIAFVPGVLIVAMAIMLDRVTTAASVRGELAARKGGTPKSRWVMVAVGGVLALVAVYLSRLFFWAATFPDLGLGAKAAKFSDDLATTVIDAIAPATEALKNVVTYGLLNPMQSFLAESPWYLAFAGITALAFVLGGVRALLPTVICLAGIRFTDLWNDAMVTLNMTIVATILVMVLAVVLGVAMARSRRVDLAVRPILDAGQTIPAFVYLVPVLAMFGPTRFTAIIAGIVYAVPIATKLVADGVSNVSATTMEAVRSQGATTMQQIRGAQLPMAKPSLVLAANQGLLYVLSMVVIGGMVGAGALGYDVVLGTSRSEEWGKGLAAGIAIVFLGILIDRIMRNAAAQMGGTGGVLARLPRWLR